MNKSHRQLGNEAEDLACNFLQNKGWQILERNYYSGHSEIDIIARENNTIVFLEVKMRSDTRFGHPFEYVTESKVEHVCKAAEKWAKENMTADLPMRFDIIGILKKKGGKTDINHIKDAYR